MAVLVSALTALLVSLNAHAIDRDAKIIDMLAGEAAKYDDFDYIGFKLWGETALPVEGDNWAFIFGGTYGEYSETGVEDVDAWSVSIGIKYYLTKVTGISLFGTYVDFDLRQDAEIIAGTVHLKQRLLPATQAISPYLIGSGSVQSAEVVPGSTDDGSFTELIVTGGAGIDFMLDDNLSFVFEGAYSESEDVSSGVDYADGWSTLLAMKYHWY